MIKSAFEFKIKYLLEFIFVVFGFILALSVADNSSQPTHNRSTVQQMQPQSPSAAIAVQAKPRQNISLQIEEAVVCLDIDNQEPLMAKSRFSRLVDRLYCFVALNAQVDREVVVHRWYYGEQLMHHHDFSLQFGRQVLISSLEMKPEWGGTWQVVIVDARGRELDRIPFVLQ